MVDPNREQLKELVLTEYQYATSLSDPARLEGWEAEGLTTAQLRILYRLNAHRGLKAGDLAAHLGVRPSTVTGIIDRLVKLDLVERNADPDDRRVVRTGLTAHGQQTISELTLESRAYIRSILERLNDAELDAAAAALTRMNQVAQDLGVQVWREPGREPGREPSPMP